LLNGFSGGFIAFFFAVFCVQFLRRERVSRFWVPWDWLELPVPWPTGVMEKKNCTGTEGLDRR
jgi:hypothetical protein